MKFFKIAILAFMGIVAISVDVHAQSCGELFKTANSLREKENYADAITYYQRAKDCDPNLSADCNKWIKYCKDRLRFLNVSQQEIHIPYQGGDERIDINANGKWSIDETPDWCPVNIVSEKEFIIQCREANNSTRDRVATITVKNGSLFKTIKIIQNGRPEFLDVAAKSLSFPSKGAEDGIKIASNANWNVSSSPSWCKVEKDEDGIKIIVNANDRVMERTGDIVIASPSNSVIIKVYQGAGDEQLALSQNNLNVPADGDVHYIKVYTDANNWFVGDYPTWMNVQKIGSDSIRIECGKNIPNGQPRSGSVQVKTDRQTAGVMITQSPLMAQNLIFPDTKLVGGRNLSFGISASYYMPFIDVSAGGDYVGSVLDYGLGIPTENASYHSKIGYSFGIFADMRLYKNIFINTGINFSQIKYKNEFSQTTTFTTPYGKYQYLKGEVYNFYKEEYTLTMIELPILASYRFKLGEVSSLQLNVGPVLNFGLKANLKLSGNTDSESLKLYNSTTHALVDNSNYVRHNAVNTDFNLYKPCVLWEESYTTGNDMPVSHHDEFQDSPFKRFNCGLRCGIAYEWAGIAFGLSYTYMLTNMANKNYWENERWTILNHSNTTMKGVKYKINTLEFKISYTLRY